MSLTETGFPLRVARSTLFKFRWMLAALLSFFLAVWAAIWSVADILQSQGIANLDASLDSYSSREQWDHGWSLLEYARELNPWQAEYPFYQAYFSHNRAQGSHDPGDNLPEDRTRSLDYFNQALKQRPHWGYVWAQLAETRSDKGDGGKQTVDALEKALVFAPYEPFVLHIALRVGFNFWERLDDEPRQKMLSAVRYLLRHDPKSVIETALLFEWSEHLRPLLLDARDLEYLDSRLAEIGNNPEVE